MCSKMRISRNDVNPGSLMMIWKSGGTDLLTWGPSPYNARLENLEGYWKTYKRGYTLIDGFYENNVFFTLNGYQFLYTAIVHNDYGFAVVTRPSKGTIVEPFHHRTPLILERPDDFINNGKIIEIDYRRLIRVA